MHAPLTVICSWMDSVASKVIRSAALSAPAPLSNRLEEEWLADLSRQPGNVSRLTHALGCYWAAMMINRDPCTASVPAAYTTTWSAHMTAYAYGFPARSSAAQRPVVCDINITPLIDVMLVLLVTLIVSLPIMTHAVKIDMPQAPPSTDVVRPEVVNLEIEFDGTIVWNGEVVSGMQQLERYLQAAARTNPQPEIHLRPNRHAKYDFVAQVMAAAQRHHLQKMGFVNTGEFGN